MKELQTQNPLHAPIQYNGQIYFTSQYFHTQYKANEGGKYDLLKDFNRLIRSIETYQNYIERNDIVELTWETAKITGADFAPVFKSNGYNPIMLINATAQVALTHHLDDEISKSISVAVNVEKATPPLKSELRHATSEYKALLSFAKLIGLTGNQAILAANKGVVKYTGVDLLEAVDSLHLVSESKEKTLTPTELGKIYFYGTSAKVVNQWLSEKGFQESYRDGKGNLAWTVAEKGKQYAEILDTGKKHSDGTPVKQIKWFESVHKLL